MPTVLKAFQGRLDESEDGSPLPLPEETSLFTVQLKCICPRSSMIKKRYIYRHSKKDAVAVVDRLLAGEYRDDDGRKVCVASEIDVLKITTKLVHTTRDECDADEEDDSRPFDPHND